MKAIVIVSLLSSFAFAGSPQIFMCSGSGTNLNTGASVYSPPFGINNIGWGIAENTQFAPSVSSGTWSEMRIILDGSPGAGKSYTFTFRTNGGDSALTCTISDAATSCSDVTHSTNTIIGDLVSYSASPSGTPTARHASVSIKFIPITDNYYMMGGHGNATVAGTLYYSLVGGASNGSTENQRWSVISPAGIWSRMYVNLSVAPGAGTSRAFTFRTNGSNSTVTCTISNTSTSCNDVINSSATVPGDIVSVGMVPSGTPANSGMSITLLFASGSSGEFPISSMGATVFSNSADNYVSLVGANAPPSATEAVTQSEANSPSPGLFIRRMYVALGTAPGSGKSYVFSLRQNAATPSRSTSCTISNTDTSCNDTVSFLPVTTGDLMDTLGHPSGTPSNGVWTIGYGGRFAPANLFPIFE